MADVIYYNITIESENPTTSGKIYGVNALPTNAQITANNNMPVLENPDQYYGSVIRFSVPCFATPLISFIVQTPIVNAQDINKGIGSFTFAYGSYTGIQSFHIYKPQIEDSILPKYPSALQDFSTYYYFLYSYSWLLDIYNTALQVGFADLQANNPAIASAKCPFFFYDAQSELIKLYADKAFFDLSLPTPIKLFFNSPTSQYYNGLVFNEVSVGSATGADNYFIIKNQNGLNLQTVSSTEYIVLTQEFISLAYLSPLKNIVITSTMNVVSEVFFVNAPASLQNNQFVNVLTDFVPDLSGGTEAGVGSKVFIYNATSLYRVFQFRDLNPLYTINIGIQWVDQLGNFYPLLLVKGTQATMKIMFIKKTVYNNLTQMGSQVLPRGITYNVRSSSRQDVIEDIKNQRNEPMPYGKKTSNRNFKPSIEF